MFFEKRSLSSNDVVCLERPVGFVLVDHHLQLAHGSDFDNLFSVDNGHQFPLFQELGDGVAPGDIVRREFDFHAVQEKQFPIMDDEVAPPLVEDVTNLRKSLAC